MISITEFIRSLRESFNGSKIVYTNGSCYQLYLILKGLYPNAEAYYDNLEGHVYTKLDGKFYDIYGELTNEVTLSIIKPLKEIPGVEMNARTWLWSIENYAEEIRQS